MSNHINQVSVTPTVARQTPKNEFGEVLKNTLSQGAQVVSGALMGVLGGSPIVSAAVSSVSQLANSPGRATGGTAAMAASGAVNTTGTGGGINSVAQQGIGPDQANLGSMNDMMRGMRAEADHSIAMQMQMQQESRDYNTISNVLKTRHDSAKAAINNIR